jgi:hypothetical protein
METRHDWRTLRIMPHHKFINEYRIIHVRRYNKIESSENKDYVCHYKPLFNGITFTKILLKYDSCTFKN